MTSDSTSGPVPLGRRWAYMINARILGGMDISEEHLREELAWGMGHGSPDDRQVVENLMARAYPHRLLHHLAQSPTRSMPTAIFLRLFDLLLEHGAVMEHPSDQVSPLVYFLDGLDPQEKRPDLHEVFQAMVRAGGSLDGANLEDAACMAEICGQARIQEALERELAARVLGENTAMSSSSAQRPRP